MVTYLAHMNERKNQDHFETLELMKRNGVGELVLKYNHSREK
jgi:hypothetical protein